MTRRRLPAILLYLGAWTLLAALAASQLILMYAYTGSGAVDVDAVVRVTAPLWYTWAALAPAVLWLARRLPLGAGPRTRNLAAHVLLTATFTVAAVALYRVLRGLAGLPSRNDFGMDLIAGVHTHVLTYWALIGIVHFVAYSRRARERDVRSAELAAELSRARLDALRMQLHPHFLFNTMHAISGSIRDDPAGAEDMLAELAELLRVSVERPAVHEIPLREELDFIGRYVGIQKVRFGDRLDVAIATDDAALDALVPALILQPLVENAIEHGIATRRDGGRLEIRTAAGNGTLTLTVADDGPGIDDRALERAGRRIGLDNTRARLAHLYGDSATFELRNRNGHDGLAAVISIPLHGEAR